MGFDVIVAKLFAQCNVVQPMSRTNSGCPSPLIVLSPSTDTKGSRQKDLELH